MIFFFFWIYISSCNLSDFFYLNFHFIIIYLIIFLFKMNRFKKICLLFQFYFIYIWILIFLLKIRNSLGCFPSLISFSNNEWLIGWLWLKNKRLSDDFFFLIHLLCFIFFIIFIIFILNNLLIYLNNLLFSIVLFFLNFRLIIISTTITGTNFTFRVK